MSTTQATYQFTDAGFEQEVLQSDVPVLVDFWAPWCGPCKALAPIVDDIANEFSDRMKVGKLDVDANQQVATRFCISSIPTMLLFVDGEVKEKLVGLRNRSDLAQLLAGYV